MTAALSAQCFPSQKLRAAVTRAAIQAIDRWAIEKKGFPAVVLMENAGRAIAEKVRDVCPLPSGQVLVFCGTGNNGGDGFVAARYLQQAGWKVRVFLIGGERGLKPEARINFLILKNLGCPPQVVRREDPVLSRELARSVLVVDAIFGVGLSREVTGLNRAVIERINQSGKKVLAVDIPSGLDATTGAVRGVCVQASWTVTFSLAKKGFYRRAGPGVTGEVLIVDIGIPKAGFSRYRR